MDIKEENMDIKVEYEPEICSTELLFETVNPLSQTNQTKSIAIFTNEETKKLIDLYRRFLTDIGPFNRFKRKKDMWSEISAQIPTKSPKQCEERLKTILKRKKKGLMEKVYLSNAKRKLMDLDDECENELSIIRKQRINSKADECVTTTNRCIQVWSNEETKKLIDLYKRFSIDIGPFNRFRRKKDMWLEISSQFPTKSAKQCEERLKTVLRRKKKGLIEKVYLSNAQRKLMDLDDECENELSIIRKQRINSKADEYITTNGGSQVWSNNETKLLAELYKNFINDVGPQKRFMHKKDMWEQISENFANKDPRQCEQRFNTVLRRKKPCMTKSYITKARRKTVDLRPRHVVEASPIKTNIVDEVEDDIVVNEDVLKPEEKEESNEQSNTIAEKPNFYEGFCLSETLEKIAAKKEEGKERRHREKMEAMAKMQLILQQMMNAIKS